MALPPAPPPSSPAARRVMQGNRRRDTAPERRVRSLLHAAGMRFRVDFPVRVAGRTVRPDIVFTRRRLAVFIDGCFWHACPDHVIAPKRNASWWREKLEGNVRRDRRTDELLREAGWSVLRAWEHEPPERIAARVGDAIERWAAVGP